MIPLVVRGLGRAELQLGALVLAPDSGMLFPLALVLAQRAGERIPRADLTRLLWPQTPETAARHSLRQALYRLRRSGLVMDDRGDDVRVDPSRIDSDITDVLRHDWPYRAEPVEIERAASLLPGFAPDEGTPCAEWYEQLRARVALQYRRATLHRIEQGRREGRWRDVDHWALMLLQADPLNEEATLARAEATAMVGAKHAAIEILDSYLRELGDRTRQIGLPARLLKRRISELTDTTGRRVTATSAPFVGRHDLLAQARDVLAEARGGTATVQWFVGPPGIGKSRLMREIERAARMAGWCAVMGDARPSYEDRPFAMITSVLPQLLDAPGALGTDPFALTLMRQMGRAETGEEPLAPEEARGRQYAVYRSWEELMEAVLAETPVALLLDDVQWSDPMTLLMLARFLEGHPTARLAVLLLARRMPVRDDALAQRVLGAPQARIAPLTEDEVRDFTQGAGLGRDEAFEEVTRRLGAASGGNPLFLGHLLHQHQTHRVPASMPTDLATLIDEQVRGLSRDAARLLQACALLGRHASLPRVERVLGVEAPALVTPFGELDDMLALPSEPGAPLAPHDLWTERVRHGMTAGVFRSLAVSAARVLEADAAADGGIELLWDAARLYQESGEKQLAYATMMRCAEYLLRTGAASDAGRAYETAAEYASSDQAIQEALMGKMRALQAQELWTDVLDTAERLRTLDVDWTSDLLAAIELACIGADWWLGSNSEPMVLRLRSIAEDEAVSSSVRLAAAGLGMAASDDLFAAEEIERFYTTAGEIVPEGIADEMALLRCKVILETSIGDLDRAEQHGRALVKLARLSKDDTSLIIALRFAHYPPRRSGNLPLALERLHAALKIADRLKRIHTRAAIFDLLAGVHLDYGDTAAAIEYSHEVTDNQAGLGGAFRQRSALDTRALALCIEGAFPRARPLIASAETVLARGRRRADLMSLAATLMLASHEGDEETGARCLEVFDLARERLFRHAGQDIVAAVYAAGQARFRSPSAARSFATWYVTEARRERLPLPKMLAAYATTTDSASETATSASG
ncbi:MAG: AAA family ATPase [Gemmatimonadota bacterium]|nr:AAA family ATPase [Gemmatimonadota bacterium]